MFYKEAYPDTPIAYIKLSDLIQAVSVRFENLMKTEDLEKVIQDYQFDFAEICRVWQRLPDAREDVSGGKNDKIAFVEVILRFLHSEKLIVFDTDQKIIYPAERFRTIIWNYYEDNENRKDLLSFVRSLEVSD